MDQIKENEIVTRYICSKNHYSSANKRVKFGAFMPARDNKTSVFRIDELSYEEVWQYGVKYVESKGDREIFARADLKIKNIIKHNLKVTPSEPPHRHANIEGWPDDKILQKHIANKLANDADLFVK